MSIINNMPNKAGMTVEGLIEEYKVYAGEEITAGGFVEFVSKSTSKTVTTQDTAISGNNICLYPISSSYILSAQCYNSAVRLQILYFSSTTKNVSTFTATTISTETCSTTIAPEIIKTTDGNYVVVWVQNYNTSTTGDLYCAIVSVSGITISVSTKQRVTTKNYIEDCRLKPVTDGCVFLYRYGGADSDQLYGRMAQISGSSITLGTELTLTTGDSVMSSSTRCAIENLTDDTLFCVYHYYTSYGGYLHPYLCTLTYTGSTLSKGLTKTLDGDDYMYSAEYKIIKISSTQVIVCLTSASLNYAFRFYVCTISSSAISAGTDTVLIDFSYGNDCWYFDIIPLGSYKYLLLYSTTANTSSDTTKPRSTFYYSFLTYSSNTITAGTATQLTTNLDGNGLYYGGYIRGALFNSTQVFIVHHYYSTLSEGQLWRYLSSSETLSNSFTVYEYETQVRNPTTEDVNGVAKVSGVEGDTISIIVPNI